MIKQSTPLSFSNIFAQLATPSMPVEIQVLNARIVSFDDDLKKSRRFIKPAVEKSETGKEKALALIREGLKTSGEVAERMEISRSAAYKHLKTLFDERVLVRKKQPGSLGEFVFAPAGSDIEAIAGAAKCRTRGMRKNVKRDSVLAYVKREKETTAARAGAATGISRQAAMHHLNSLVEYGLLDDKVFQSQSGELVFRAKVEKCQ